MRVMAEYAHPCLDREVVGPFILSVYPLVMAVEAELRGIVVQHPAVSIGTVGIMAEGAHAGRDRIMNHLCVKRRFIMTDVTKIRYRRGKEFFVIRGMGIMAR